MSAGSPVPPVGARRRGQGREAAPKARTLDLAEDADTLRSPRPTRPPRAPTHAAPRPSRPLASLALSPSRPSRPSRPLALSPSRPLALLALSPSRGASSREASARRAEGRPRARARHASRPTALARSPAAWLTVGMGPVLIDAPLLASPETAEEIREDETAPAIDVSPEDLRRWAETGEWPESFA